MYSFRKKRKLREKAEAEAKNNEDKKKKMKSGVHVGMSGRDMFLFDENMGSNEVHIIRWLLFYFFSSKLVLKSPNYVKTLADKMD